jgi:AraC-like DNA-binding protein
MTATRRARTSHHGQWQLSGRVIALVIGRADAARVTASLKPMPVQVVHTLDALRAALSDPSCECSGLLLEARDINGESTRPVITAVVNGGARFPVLGYAAAGAIHVDSLRELARAGVHELVFRDIDDAPAFLSGKFMSAEETRGATTVLAHIASIIPERLVAIADYVLNFPRESHSVVTVASALGINRKTLTNWCARESCPPPGIIITWCRLLLAAELLQVPGRSVERVAHSLQFASGSAFRNLCQRYLGRRPSTIRSPGAMEDAYRKFADYMALTRKRGLSLGHARVADSVPTSSQH